MLNCTMLRYDEGNGMARVFERWEWGSETSVPFLFIVADSYNYDIAI